jgi:diamine N-acetyltransferase
VDLKQIIFRDALAQDAEALAALARDTFIATFGPLYPAHDLASFVAQTYGAPIQRAQIADTSRAFRLAVQGDDLIGYCGIGPMKLPFDAGGRRTFEIYTLYVVEAAKGAGVANALMDWAIANSRARGAQDLYLGVYADNARAQRFYTRHGFEIVGRYDFPVGATIDDERIMRLKLA